LRTHYQTGLVSRAALITHEGRSLHKSVFLLCHIAFYEKLIVVTLSRHILCLVSASSYNGKNMKSIHCGRKGFLISMELGEELTSQMRVLSQPICCFTRVHLQKYSFKRLKSRCENSRNCKKINTHINIYM
jgi:hypothetical protein